MLAMDVNDDDGCLTPRVAWTTIASKLAPTGGCALNVRTPLNLWELACKRWLGVACTYPLLRSRPLRVPP